MNKVTITLQDTEDGEVNTSFRFNPPIKRGEELTPCQKTASVIAEMLNELFESKLEAVNGVKIENDRN